jgi:hypothetical protein
MSALEALAAVKAARIKLTLEDDGIVLETKTPPLPADVVALLKAAKPDLMRILEWREAARVAAYATPPEDCGLMRLVTGIRRFDKEFIVDGVPEIREVAALYGVRESRWARAMHGLRRFVLEGWGDQACLFGWSKEELYRVPHLWSQIHLTGAALLIGDRRVMAVTDDNIVVTTRSSSTLKFRRIGREHLA